MADPIVTPLDDQNKPLAAPAGGNPPSSITGLSPTVTPLESASKGETTAGGLATSLARGLGPTALGAGAGAVVGGLATLPMGGVGAIPGAEIGAGLAGSADTVIQVVNTIARTFGLPESWGPRDISDWLIDKTGGKPREDSSTIERLAESGVSGGASSLGMAHGAEALSRTLPIGQSTTKRVADALADNPLVQTVGGALGGVGSQGTQELGAKDPIVPMLGGIATSAWGGALTRGMRRPIGAASKAMGLEPPQFVNEGNNIATQNKARGELSKQFNIGVQGGAKGAVDVMESLQEAKREGQDYRLADVKNTELQSRIGTVYRQGGVPRSKAENFFTKRDEASRGVMKRLFSKYISSESAMKTSNKLIDDRSVEARPLWDKARRGLSIATMEGQFQASWVRAGREEQEATQRLTQAQQAITHAAARKATASNSLLQGEADKLLEQAKYEWREAQDALTTAQRHKQMSLDKLQKSQTARETDAPGTVWSPRLQELYDKMPIIRNATQKGFLEEKMEAVSENRPVHAFEYAVNEEGEIIAAPTMRMWMAAKTGLDSIINAPGMFDEHTGKPFDSTVPLIKLRDALIGELDFLNPDYKPARDHWSGKHASMEAVRMGKNSLNNSRSNQAFSPEELQEYHSKLSDGDKQFFLVGLVDELERRLRGAPEATDKAKIIDNNVRERLAIVLPDPVEANRFMNAVERQSDTKKTHTEISGKSPTAGRVSDDQQWHNGLGALSDTVGAGAYVAHGNPIMATRMLVRGMSRLWHKKPNMPLNEAIIELALDPDIGDLIAKGSAAQGKGSDLFPGIPMPKTLDRRLFPGSVIGAANSLGNIPRDTSSTQ